MEFLILYMVPTKIRSNATQSEKQDIKIKMLTSDLSGNFTTVCHNSEKKFIKKEFTAGKKVTIIICLFNYRRG